MRMFYTQVIKSSQEFTDKSMLPRKRKIPKRIDDDAEPHQFSTPEAKHRQQYILALNKITNELLRRFDLKDLNVVHNSC